MFKQKQILEELKNEIEILNSINRKIDRLILISKKSKIINRGGEDNGISTL